MKRQAAGLRFLPAAIAVWMLAGSGVVLGQAESTITNLQLPLDATLANPCTGELIVFSGTTHLVIKSTSTPSGNFNATVHQNLQGVSGTGVDSGDTFRFQFPSNQTLNAAAGQVSTVNVNVRVVGPGPGNNFLSHEVLHVTINANGEATASFDHLTASCQ